MKICDCRTKHNSAQKTYQDHNVKFTLYEHNLRFDSPM